jgi:trehalose synthase
LRPTVSYARRSPACSPRSSDRWRSTIPRAGRVYEQVSEHAVDDPHIHLYTNLTGVGNVEVNALQRLFRGDRADVDPRRLWARRVGVPLDVDPVVAGRPGGIPLRMAEGVGGLLVDSVEECPPRC